MTEKRFTYLDASRNKYIGSFFCNDVPLTNDEVVDLLNENEQLKQKNERYKRLIEIKNEQINNRILTIREFIDNCSNEVVKNALQDLFYSEVNEYDLAKENRVLCRENERMTNKLNELAFEFLNHDMVSMGKATEMSEMSYHDFLKYRKEKGNPMELQL